MRLNYAQFLPYYFVTINILKIFIIDCACIKPHNFIYSYLPVFFVAGLTLTQNRLTDISSTAGVGKRQTLLWELTKKKKF